MRSLAIALLLAAPAAHADDLFALSGQASPVLHKLDPATGAILESHAISGHQALFGGLALSASGQFFSIDGNNDLNPDRLFRIDPATGAGTIVGPTGFNWNFRCLCLDPVSGTLFASTDNTLHTINTTTGAATVLAAVSGSPNFDQMTAFAISPTGQAFCTDIGNTDLFSLNLQTGFVTWIGAIGGISNWFSDLAFDSAGTLHGVRVSGGVFSINTTTAALTSDFSGNYTGLVYIFTATCYANCDASTGTPLLTANDFTCFINQYATQSPAANCDGSTGTPLLTANDFTCFINAYAAGCP